MFFLVIVNFSPLYTDFLCLLAGPLGFADPPSGSPAAERTHRWLMLAVKTCFLRSMCPALSLATPCQPPAHTCSTPCTTDTDTTLDSLVGHLRLSLPSSWLPRLCPPSRFLGLAFPVVVPRCLACLVLPTISVPIPVILTPHCSGFVLW
jgi:hypothetical protein